MSVCLSRSKSLLSLSLKILSLPLLEFEFRLFGVSSFKLWSSGLMSALLFLSWNIRRRSEEFKVMLLEFTSVRLRSTFLSQSLPALLVFLWGIDGGLVLSLI